VIDRATKKVTTVPVPSITAPYTVGVAPDGKHLYIIGGNGDENVLVIDTASFAAVATIPLAQPSSVLALTPDGKHLYVGGFFVGSNRLLVFDTATNELVTTAQVRDVNWIGIVPPPPGIPFAAFGAKLAIQFGSIPTKDTFGFGSNFTLSSTAPGINPLTDPVTLQVGTFTTTIPPGSFKKQKDGSFAFKGVIDGVSLEALIKQTVTLRYAFQAKATGANLTGVANTVYVTLTIGGDSGVTSVTAEIS
jgi:hypothetical protein